MVLGHGIIDYIVVVVSLAATAYTLAFRPQALLLLLPTFVTIDFFVPFISQLTPGRLVPLMILAWWALTGKHPFQPPVQSWLIGGIAITIASTAAAMLIGDTGLRPIIRSLNYLNLIALCGFAWQQARDSVGITKLFQGFAIAGCIHGGHACYQLVANRVGLPYRGIVYSASGGAGSGVVHGGGFRINGFADEPKRLGMILIASAVALIYLASQERLQNRKIAMQVAAVTILGVSLLTYSTSYLAAIILWGASLTLISSKSWRYSIAAMIVGFGGYLAMSERIDSLASTQWELLEAREEEMEKRIGAKRVYRQDFFAEDYLNRNPSAWITGVGMGRYYSVFRREYGSVAGIGPYNNLLPLNSQLLETCLDATIFGCLLVYAGSLLVFRRLLRGPQMAFMLAAIILFQMIQSLFVQSFPLLVLAVGAGAAGIAYGWRPPESSRRYASAVSPNTFTNLVFGSGSAHPRS
ncbi:hypothetical protein [Rhodopirellula bahusiensis]